MAANLTIATKDAFPDEDTRINDIYLDANGNLAMADDAEGCAEIVLHAVRTQQGELEFNEAKGVPYMETIFTDRANLPLWAHYMQNAMVAVDGVEKVSEFLYTITGDRLEYSASITTANGEIGING